MYSRQLKWYVGLVLVVGLAAPAVKTASEESGSDVQQAPLAPTVTADIASRYIQITPDMSNADPVAFRVECGGVIEWVELTHPNYDDGGGVFVNIGKVAPGSCSGTATPCTIRSSIACNHGLDGTCERVCDNSFFLKPDVWTSSGANALYVTGLSVAPGSRPTVYAVAGDCTTPQDSDPVQPALPTWVFCDASGDGAVTFFADLFKQFQNTAAGGPGPGFEGLAPGIEVDTEGFFPTVPDQQVTFYGDIFQCFQASSAGGGFAWNGEACP